MLVQACRSHAFIAGHPLCLVLALFLGNIIIERFPFRNSSNGSEWEGIWVRNCLLIIIIIIIIIIISGTSNTSMTVESAFRKVK